MFLTGYTVAMVTYNVKNTTVTYSPMIRHLLNTIIVKSTDKEW